MKAVVAAFNQEKALVGAFSVITTLRMELFVALVPVPHLVIGCPKQSEYFQLQPAPVFPADVNPEHNNKIRHGHQLTFKHYKYFIQDEGDIFVHLFRIWIKTESKLNLNFCLERSIIGMDQLKFDSTMC